MSEGSGGYGSYSQPHHLQLHLDGLPGKFRDFLGSGKAVARLSDLICLEHGLSVIENPKRGGTSYKSWLGDRARPSRRDLLRAAIDAALEEKPADFDALLSLVSGAG